jgi:hypothetical protein
LLALAFSSTLKMGIICSSKLLINFTVLHGITSDERVFFIVTTMKSSISCKKTGWFLKTQHSSVDDCHGDIIINNRHHRNPWRQDILETPI